MQQKCALDTCNNKATHSIRLSLAVNNNHDPAISTPLMFLCEQHKDNFTFECVVGQGNWEKICRGFDDIGRMRPVKEYSRLLITKIEDEQRNNSTIPQQN